MTQLGATPQPPNALQAIKTAAKANNVDWRAMASIAQHESGLDPANVGDNGTSFGLFQLHQGGALPRGTNPALAKTAAWNANFAARQIKGLGIGGAMPVEEQIRQIAARFERPANVAGEQQAALGYYRTRYAGMSGIPDTTGAPTAPATTPASEPLVSAPSLSSLSAATLAPLQQRFSLGQQNTQRALDALGSISGNSVRAAAAPDLSALTQSATTQLQPTAQHASIDVPLKGKTPTHLDPQAQKAVDLAKHYLGTKYVFGAADPKRGFDCSGLLAFVWGKLGVKLPHNAAAQYELGTKVGLKQLQAGDAVFFRNSEGIHHVGMALGNGQFIQAPHTGDVVKISSLADPYYAQQFAGGRRYA